MGMVKQFCDGSYLEFDNGNFDEFCVYLKMPNCPRKPPKDTDYFSEVKELARKYGREKIYRDYVNIYNQTNKNVEQGVLALITETSLSYEAEDRLKVDKLLSILYMAMIAEENKKYTRLGKRIKRLGIYMLLFENKTVADAANFMRGMKAQEIAALCTERGF